MVLSLLTPISSVSAMKTEPFKAEEQNESVLQQKLAIAEQLRLTEQAPTLHKGLEELKGKQEVDVIIHLSEKPVSLEKGIKEVAGGKFTKADEKSVKALVVRQQNVLKKEMKANGINFKESFSYGTVLNGFAATVKADDLEKILGIEGVTLVEPDAEVHAYEDNSASSDGKVSPTMDTSTSFLGIEPLWAEGYEGQGIKVAVLDTGIDAHHPDFAGIYKGGKNFIPNSSTYSKTRADDDASETLPSERPASTPEFNANGSSFYTSHGTHVAGTIAAIGNNEFGIKGIAPKVDLYAYRVLGAYGSGSTSGIIAAIEEAVIQEMDVINLSLGGGSNTETDAGSFAINNAMLAGVISVIATGNSGPKRETMGTPSTAPFGIAVGNTTNPEKMYNVNVSVEAGNYNLSSQLNLMSTTYGTDLSQQLAGEFDLVAVPGIGKPADFDGLDVDGKVALIARGEIAFVEKIENARANGAVATIIHNSHNGSNTPGISNVFLGNDFAFLPTVDMSYTDGVAIRTALEGADGAVTFTNVQSTTTKGDEVNDSSSRGPSVPNFDIKPDVSAPGTNIMSTIPMYKADFPDVTYEHAYTRKTGTSMATPHIAGIAALVQQANPDWNAFDVKVALSNTAKILDTDKYDVFAQGAGRVNAYAAAHANVLAYAVDEALPDSQSGKIENLKGTVTFGPQSLKENLTVTKEILVKDLKKVGGNFDVSVDVTKGFADAAVTVDKSSFTLDGEEVITVTLTASLNENTKPGDEILGYIHINGGDSELSLPFAADFGGVAAATIEGMSISETDLSFDGDGYKDSATLAFKLTGDVQANFIELWDIMNPKGGQYGDGYIGYIHAGASLGAGSYTLNVAGQYKPWSSNPATTIPDGLYTINFKAATAAGSIGDYAGPIVVKSSPGTIESAVEGTKVTGKVIDKYVDYQTELVKYGLGFNINTKLTATSEVTNDGETVSTPITLEQDGSFTFDIGNQTPDNVVVKYVDAAGNKAEKIVIGDVEEPEVPGEGIEITPLDPVPSEPIAADNPYVESFGFDSIAISPNEDGKGDVSNFSYEFKQAPNSSVYINVFDPTQPTAGRYGDGIIGDIHWDYNRAQSATGTFDGVFTDADSFDKKQLKDGVYGMELYSFSKDYRTMNAWVKPFFVKSTAPEITFEADDKTITGSINDQFIGFKSVVEEGFEQEYDVNNYLVVTAYVKNADGELTENAITLEQDGTFTSTLEGVSGLSKVTVVAQDIAQNDAQETVSVEGEEPVVPEKMSRISGSDRYQTALEISSEGWESAETVIIARGNDFADALAGVPLAYAMEAPILLTLTNELSEDVLAEIERLGATEAIILGGKAAVSEDVQVELVNADITVTRASGKDRFATAAAIADLVAPNGSDEVAIANGMDFPDALSVASHAAEAGTPILLTLKDTLPAATTEALEKLGATNTVVVGGTAVVSATVANALPSMNRLGGLDRYETNTLIAKHYGVDNDHLYVATGKDYADALTGAVLAANTNSAVLLVHAVVPDYVSSYITNQDVQRLTIFGGENAVNAEVYKELERLVD